MEALCQQHERYPPVPSERPLHVAIYLQTLIDTSSSASSDETAFYALQWAHNLAGVPSPTAHPTVIAIRDAAQRLFGKHRENRKEPISAESIKTLVRQANLNNLLDLRNVCIFVLAFAGFFRIEEVLHIKRNDIRLDGDRVIIRLERSKTDQLRLGNEVVISRVPGSRACPVSLLESYLSLAQIHNASELFVFRPISKTSSGHRLVSVNKAIGYSTIREAFEASFKNIVPNIGDISTHSLRAGGASAAANAGVADRLFQRHGRWKSTSAKDGYALDDINARTDVSKHLGL